MSKRKILIIGGGAAGLMAAGMAARAGADVLVLEKMKRVGIKLGITGKGRCNLTNTAGIADFISHFGNTGSFLHQAFARFFNKELMAFFVELGLELTTERGGRVFPASGRARDVIDVLLKWLKQTGVRFKYDAPVDRLIVEKDRVAGVVCNKRKFYGDAVIIATGGASYPVTGSTGDGYRFAESVGHRIVSPRPALVPLVTAGNTAGRMAGLNLRNVMVSLWIDGKKSTRAFGELVFTDFGVTGPTILTLSGMAVDALNDGIQPALSIDLKPALDEKKLDARLIRDFASRGKEPMGTLLRGILPREMVPICLALTDISPGQQGSVVTAAQRKRLRNWLKNVGLTITGYRPFSEALVTAGGVPTREVDPRTMASRLIRDLYFAGEVLDIQADTGGYNLQAAFSTGRLAGRTAAKRE